MPWDQYSQEPPPPGLSSLFTPDLDASKVPEPSSGGSGMAKFAAVMKQILPLIAAAGAFKQGALGSYTGGMLDVREQQRRAKAEEDDRAYRQRTEDRYGRQEDRVLQGLEIQEQRYQAQQAAAQEANERSLISQALAPLSKNPMYADGISPDEAQSLAINVPGLGVISLGEALQKMSVAQDDEGTFHIFEPLAPPRPPSLTTGIGPGGRPTRVPDVEGTPVYERPRVGPQPEKPKKATVKIEDTGAGLVVTFSDPETGLTETLTEEEIATKLSAQGWPSDVAAVRKVMRNPKALRELIHAW